MRYNLDRSLYILVFGSMFYMKCFEQIYLQMVFYKNSLRETGYIFGIYLLHINDLSTSSVLFIEVRTTFHKALKNT